VPDPDAARRLDLVERDFTTTGPDELYVADFTYLHCWSATRSRWPLAPARGMAQTSNSYITAIADRTTPI
jgi:hypothetical protein